MRSLERHRDVGAYALGVLDEADAFRFEDHLVGCSICATHMSGFDSAVRQLMLYRRVVPRSVVSLAAPGPRLLERLLDAVSARHRGIRRRRLYAVAAAVGLAVAGPAVAVAFEHGSSGAMTALSGTDPSTGVWARIAARDRVWGGQIDATVKDRTGPHTCRLVVVGTDGSEQTVMSWTVPADDRAATTVQGNTALRSAQIDHYELRTRSGRHLITLKPR